MDSNHISHNLVGTTAGRPGSARATYPCTRTPDLWFAERPDDVEVAKALCRDCPARRRCLSTALARQEPWGVWGGELFEHGRVIPRKRGRGRPRKKTAA